MDSHISELKNSVIPICVGYSDGNGFVIGNMFFTAGHVANKDANIFIKINGDSYHFPADEAIAILDEDRQSEGHYSDFAIFQLPIQYNSIAIDKTIPSKGEKLLSFSYKHEAKTYIINNGDNLFSNMAQETYEIHTSIATITDVIGNFIVCEMSETLEEGRSGSPLFRNGKVIGLLHGGIDNGRKCVFQTMSSILTPIITSKQLEKESDCQNT